MGSTYITGTEDFIEALHSLKESILKLIGDGEKLSFIREIHDLHLIANELNQQFERFRIDSELREERQMSAILKLTLEVDKLKKAIENESSP